MINGQSPNILAVIPARYASTRFPGKPLVMIQGKTMIQRVYEQTWKSSLVKEVVIATDDERIYAVARSFGATVLMTKPEHPSGTDRCAEAAAHFKTADLILNVQGDEPFIQPEQIDLLAQTLLDQPEYGIATLARQITDPEQLFNPNVVKVVRSEKGEALYFSRHPIPYLRGHAQEDWLGRHRFFKHIGLYGFSSQALREVSKLYPTSLELAESLEQLRWLENGYRIAVGITELETIGIDTPDDLNKVSRY